MVLLAISAASREIPSEFSCASGIFAKRCNRSSDRAVLGMLVLRWKPCLWRLRHRGPCLRRPPRLERLSCALARFQPAHAHGGASRESPGAAGAQHLVEALPMAASLRHRGPCLRRPPRLERLSCPLAAFPTRPRPGRSQPRKGVDYSVNC